MSAELSRRSHPVRICGLHARDADPREPRAMGGSVGRPTATAMTTAIAARPGSNLQHERRKHRRQKCADRHHGERFQQRAHERDADRRHPLSDAGDAKNDGQRFAGHVLAQVAEEVRAKRRRPRRRLAKRGQRAVPEPGHRHEADRVERAGNNEPRRLHVPLVLRQLGQRAADRAADAQANEHKNDHSKRPDKPAAL